MTTRTTNDISPEGEVLYLALELADKRWRLAFLLGERTAQYTIEARDLGGLQDRVTRVRGKWAVPESVPVVCGYEAGRDGFWLARALTEQLGGCQVMDSGSIEVDRRRRRAKTDRLDAAKLAVLLRRWHRGEGGVRMVRVPTVAAESIRHLHREREVLIRERTRTRNALGSLLCLHGVEMPALNSRFLTAVAALRQWNGEPLPAEVRERVSWQWQRYQVLQEQLREVQARQAEAVLSHGGERGPLALVGVLMSVCGLGLQTAWTLVMEALGWRRFSNRREAASCVGLVPSPYDSGESRREQGISKVGSRRLRTVLIELAWRWLRLQPDSALSRDYQTRFAALQRVRKVGIVALARRLWLLLWRLSVTGQVPPDVAFKVEGAVQQELRTLINRRARPVTVG